MKTSHNDVTAGPPRCRVIDTSKLVRESHPLVVLGVDLCVCGSLGASIVI